METLDMFFDSIKNNLPVVSVVITVSLAFLGYLATYLNARMLARKKDRLELVNKRLNEFYGPLFVATQAGQIAFDSLMKKAGKEGNIYFANPGKASPTEMS